MSNVGDSERKTQKRVVGFFQDKLYYHERNEEGDISTYTYAPGAGYQGVIYVRIPLKQ